MKQDIPFEREDAPQIHNVFDPEEGEREQHARDFSPPGGVKEGGHVYLSPLISAQKVKFSHNAIRTPLPRQALQGASLTRCASATFSR